MSSGQRKAVRRKNKRKAQVSKRRRRLGIEPLEDRILLAADFGDAPLSYHAGFAPAQHEQTMALEGDIYLGIVAPDTETMHASGAATPDGTQDDTTGTADEDGVTFSGPFYQAASVTASVVVNSPNPAPMTVLEPNRTVELDAWIDFNGNGVFDSNERITAAGGDPVAAATLTVTERTHNIVFTVPQNAVIGTTYARFRLSPNGSGGLSPSGAVDGGEVEDLAITILAGIDFGDAPDTYGTTLGTGLADGPARHRYGTNTLYFGERKDFEADGIPTPDADGDDDDTDPAAMVDDEDGITFIDDDTSDLVNKVMQGATATVVVEASAAGVLNAFLDFNDNGNFADAGEQIFTNQALTAGSNVLTFDVPSTATATTATYARFRISSAMDISFLGSAPDGEVEDYKVEIEKASDFGDAPNSYGTTGGPEHELGSALFLGVLVDSEADGQPSALANGDNLAGLNDEDGVTFGTLTPGAPAASIVVVSSATGLLNAWIDFNQDGDFGDSGEQIFMDEAVSAGTNNLTAMISGTAVLGTTYARFRVSTAGGDDDATGTALDGEVEDYQVTIESDQDFGDAPNSYLTTLGVGGAVHELGDGTLFLGALKDFEANGLPSVAADGDDNDGTPNDEDGVTISTLAQGATAASIDVVSSGSGLLNAWIDFDQDGMFETGEQIFDDVAVSAGTNTLTGMIPGAAMLGTTYARFRVSTLTVAGPGGSAADGEVEDYRVTIVAGTDFGDAPNSYLTTEAVGGAEHGLGDGTLFLGALKDFEASGFPSVAADGDDNDGTPNDEDGVTFGPLGQGAPAASIDVVSSATGLLNAWIDFNQDGDFGDTGEQIFMDEAVSAGTNNLTAIIPGAATVGTTYARFRVSTLTVAGPGGVAADGEVEDYQVTIVAGNDFGDAPDSYDTTLAAGGAVHGLGDGTLFLGALKDFEANGLPSVAADGDDNDGTPNDEDGVTFGTLGQGATAASIDVVSSASGLLNAWIDFDQNGMFETGEQIFDDVAVSAGTNNLTAIIPVGAMVGSTYARFRVSTLTVAGPGGSAADGEVEDYQVTIEAFQDFGDAPDSYDTTLAAGGAVHGLGDGTLFLGTLKDFEANGLPSVAADGDDNDGTPNDEDGVTFGTLGQGATAASIDVVSSASGLLNAWIDFDQNGMFETGEQIFDDVAVSAGTNNLTAIIPVGAMVGSTYARFRVSTLTVAGPGGSAADGEVEDYQVTIEAFQDFGDAPDSYDTTLAAGGAVHGLGDGTLFLGALKDFEANGLPSVAADGDDNDGTPNDEDGVTFGTLGQGATAASIDVVSSASGLLNAWIDFDQNGMFETGEQIFDDVAVSAGTNNLTAIIPVGAMVGSTYARFRVSTLTVAGPGGSAADGEVEDYQVTIVAGSDFGDAPDSYDTTVAVGGAAHGLGDGTLFLGALKDFEADGQPSAAADGDDVNGTPNDEDGVTFGTLGVGFAEAAVTVVSSAPGLLNAWIDFDQSGTFEAGEQIFDDVTVSAGTNSLTAIIPATATVGTTYARFRVSTATVAGPGGSAADGEVEDYQVDIVPGIDFGDAPDSYGTLLATGGVRHLFGENTLFLGALKDFEEDGQPSDYADADDLTGTPDDEDGVTFTDLVRGREASVDVVASEAGFLNAWFDFNGNGTFEPGERIFAADAPLTAGVNHFEFDVPLDAVIGQTFARFRVTSETGKALTPIGEAPDGEVEDYGVVILQEQSAVIGETGSVTFSQANAAAWTPVALDNTYVDPVVIAHIGTFNGTQPSTLRIRNVTGTSFEIQIDEWDYLDGHHTSEDVSFLVVESGTYTLEDGTKLVAGTQSVNHNWSTVSLGGSFTTTPAVFSLSQTYNGTQAITARQKGVTSSSVDVRLQEEEGNDGAHKSETVGFVAIETGTGLAGTTGDVVTDAWHSLSIGPSPVLFASMQTFDGTDPAAMRSRTLGGAVQVKVEEEQSLDAEVAHTTEKVAFLAFAQAGDIRALTSPLSAAGGAASSASSQVLTSADVDPLVDQAIAAWAAAGISDSQLDRLEGLRIGIADLSGALLGQQAGNTITLDVNAAGYGWHIGTAAPAADRMDLLTVIYHEMGHAIGLEHGEDDDVMDDLLGTGTRHIPTAGDLDALFASDSALDNVLS